MAAGEVEEQERWAHLPPGQPRVLASAAVDAFAEHGFHGTTTRDIARRAGMSPAGLYVHFPSKAAVLHAISRAGHLAAWQLLDGALAKGAPSVDRVAGAIGTFAAWHARHHRVGRVVQYELGALEPEAYAEIAALRRKMQDRLREELDALQAVGKADVPDSPGLARALMSLCIDVCRWYDPRGPDQPEDIGALYGLLARRMLAARR